MAKKDKYYVLVLTTEGAKFATSFGEKNHIYWDVNEKPMELDKNFAQNIAIGLTVNGNPAFCVAVSYEIEDHPFLYDRGHFEWVWNSEKDK